MDDGWKIDLSEADKKAYGKLSAAAHDLSMALQYGAFILKKEWNAKPWSRGSIYLQQSAFVTAMLTSYGRAFTISHGYGKLPEEFLSHFSPEELEHHNEFLKLRHQVYAHTDSESYWVEPYRHESIIEATKSPHHHLEHNKIRSMNDMCRKIMRLISEKCDEIKRRY